MSTSRTALGRAGEEAAARWLAARGYQILARNFRVRGGELDLVCRHDGVLVFVEVKSRRSTSFGHAVESVSRQKQMRLKCAARRWLSENGMAGRACRFDLVTLECLAGGSTHIDVLENILG